MNWSCIASLFVAMYILQRYICFVLFGITEIQIQIQNTDVIHFVCDEGNKGLGLKRFEQTCVVK